MSRLPLGPLGERDFRLLFAGRLVSFVGSAFAPVALAFAVLDDLDASASALGLVLAAIWLPQMAFVLVGGVVADRLPRHLVLVVSNVASGAAQAAAAVLLLTGTAEIWHLVALQLVRGAATAFFYPASTGIVPQVVPQERLQEANVLLRMTNNVAFVLGSAVAGLAVATIGAGWALAFDAATYVASAAILVPLRLTGRLEGGGRFVHELREGWSEFRSRQWVWVIVVAAAAGNMVWSGAWNVLGPLVADRELGGAAAWGAIVSAQAVGLFAGGLVALRLRPKRPLLVAQTLIVLVAAPLAALALAPGVAVVALAAATAGFVIELFGVYWDTALQRNVPQSVLSRVSSYDALGSFVLIPVGLSIVGPVADAVGPAATLWGAAAVYVAAQVAGLASREVRNLRAS